MQTQLNCSWEIADPESSIDYLLLSLATDKLDKNRITSIRTSNSLCSASFDVMNFSANQSYFVTIYGYNRAGLESIASSDAIYFDISSPIRGGSLFVTSNFGELSYTDISGDINTTSEAHCVWYASSLELRFSQSSDEESGIKEYHLGIGHVLGGDDVLAFQKITPQLNSDNWATFMLQSIDDIDPETREPYFFTVRGFNNAGLYSDITSVPVYVKSEVNMLPSWVIDGESSEAEDRDYQHSSTQAAGKAFFGINCPMKKVEWSIQGVDGMIVKNFTEVDLEEAEYADNSYSFSSDQVMYDNEGYRLIVRGIDYSGQTHIIKSDGIMVTKRPLLPGFVVEGLADLLEINYQKSLTSLSINYDGFGDGTEEQRIEYYEVALGSDKEHLHTKSDIVPFTDVGLAKAYTFTGLDLVPLTQQYYATVRARAVSGAVAEATSNGIVVGLTHSITPGTIHQTSYQFNNSFLGAYWTGFESNVPITRYEWALGTRRLNYSHLQSMCDDRTDLHESDFEAFGFQNVDTDTHAISYDLSLEHGLGYYVTLRITDQSDMCIALSSTTPTIIDRTIPLVQKIVVGPKESRINLPSEDEYIAYLLENNDLMVSWEDFIDSESGIETYEIGLFKLEKCLSQMLVADEAVPVVDYADVGLINKFTFDDLELLFNVSYVVKIRATNQAGSKAVGTSQPIMLDTYELTAGGVKDGSDWESDVVFQSDLTKLSGAIALSYFQPQSDEEVPCPSPNYYSLDTPHVAWSSMPFSEFSGIESSAIRYESGIISFSSKTGMTINAALDPTQKQFVSGAYYTTLNNLSGQKSISMTVRPAVGDKRLQQYIATSILILETSNDDLLVEYDPTMDSESTADYKALGLQIHTQGSTTDEQQLILWSKDNDELSLVRTISHDVALNISNPHEVRFEFSYESNGLVSSRKVEVYIDGIMRIALHDIPHFSSNAKLVLHLFNREGYLPECIGDCPSNPPAIAASFSDVSLPPNNDNGACSYGSPFYSWGSPIVEVKAGIGTSIDLADIKQLEVS